MRRVGVGLASSIPGIGDALMTLKTVSLLLLRISLGWLMVLWGYDKISNVDHAVRVSEGFYGGLVTGAGVWQAAGCAQVLLGLVIVVGVFRRFAYPVLLLITGVTLLAVWKSILDPFGLVTDGGNLIFFPSSTIFFAGLALIAFRADDVLALDARLGRTSVAAGSGGGTT
jgi:uncharacterized membrane protein YphA (DoxX/SURF4 family)